jgi:hypothetical protein
MTANCILIAMLNEINIPVVRGSDFHQSVSETHRKLWIENGDVLSLYYTGYKSVGQYFLDNSNSVLHAFLGMKLNAVIRFYHNAFCDAGKQEKIDFLLGVHPFVCESDTIETLDSLGEEFGELTNVTLLYTWAVLTLKDRYAPSQTTSTSQVVLGITWLMALLVVWKMTRTNLKVFELPLRVLDNAMMDRHLL